MRRFVTARLLIFAALLLILQYAFSPFFLLLKGRVDLLYLLVLDYAFSENRNRVPFFALAVGFLRDFLGGHLFGIETLSFTVTGLLLYFGTLKLERESYAIRLGMAFLFIFITETLSFCLGSGVETTEGASWNLLGSVLLTTIYTTAVAPAFFWLSDRWFKREPVWKQYELFQ